MTLQALTFDLDDTLWAVEPVIELANQTLWSWLEERAPRFTQAYQFSDLAEGSALRAQVLSRYPEIAHSVTLIRLKLLETALADLGYPVADAQTLAAQAFAAFMEARHQVTLFAHARTSLETLHRQGLRLGALSNGNAQVKRTGLADLFEFQLNADQVGQAKPHPLMFEQALAYLQLNPTQVVHIGDHPVNDVEAAQALGIWTVWVNLSGQAWPGGRPADVEIRSLADLPDAIAQLQARALKRQIL